MNNELDDEVGDLSRKWAAAKLLLRASDLSACSLATSRSSLSREPAMTTYDGQSFQSPAPVASVKLRDPQSGKSVADVQLLIDTGADVTLSPRASIEKLGLQPNTAAQYELAGFDGQRSLAAAVDLDRTFADTVIRGRYLLTDDLVGILGRDVLNFFVTFLDGPAGEWSSTRPEQG